MLKKVAFFVEDIKRNVGADLKAHALGFTSNANFFNRANSGEGRGFDGAFTANTFAVLTMGR